MPDEGSGSGRRDSPTGRQPQPEAAARRRVRVRVEGIVQGVGFRPHVYRLADTLDLSGFVRNDARGVLLEVEGDGREIDRFLERLSDRAPPLARIERIATEERPISEDPSVGGRAGSRAAGDGTDTRATDGGPSEEPFRIVASEDDARPSALVSPDTATCDDCLRELFDPDDRRYRYPFINCTNCGPRFTIVRGIPYDRPLTTMAGFTMCEACRSEYEDPADRRFHAQPNACPGCGPTLRLVGPDATASEDSEDPVAAAGAALRSGAIVAVKGLGGFHLACVADHADAVSRLRSRKHREDKPFALMAPGLEAIRRLVHLDETGERLLTGRQRPILLARRRTDAPVADAVAPGHRDLGVMLPYSPLHHLLLRELSRPLVMTSGNVSDEPIAYRDEEALERLDGIADLFLIHDRPIETRTDDSVLRVVSIAGRRRPLMLRRSRGYAPAPIELPADSRPLLATGAQLKNTFCVARGRRAWVGPHIGDLENWETLRSYRSGVEHLERLFEVAPEVVAHDHHPEYLSTKYALERSGAVPFGIQHHHAHMAACLAEHGRSGPALGVIYDGTGYGSDGTVWGGEILAGDLSGFERVGHLWPVRLPGGEAAIREPWRMACAWLLAAGAGVGAGPHERTPAIPPTLEERVDPSSWEQVAELVRKEVASPITTSVGRLFDAVSALCGLRARVTYEGQAAIELEMAAARADAPGEGGGADYGLPLVEAEGADLLDARGLVRGILGDLVDGVPAPIVARGFHRALSDATARLCAEAAARRELDTVVLSGGVFQNVLLLERTSARLSDLTELEVLVPERLPPNDGGISYGQAAVAAVSGRPGAGDARG